MEWIFGERNDAWMGFLTRDTLANATRYPHSQARLSASPIMCGSISFTEAVDKLSNTPMLAPAYFILGGAKSGEVGVTRGVVN